MRDKYIGCPARDQESDRHIAITISIDEHLSHDMSPYCAPLKEAIESGGAAA